MKRVLFTIKTLMSKNLCCLTLMNVLIVNKIKIVFHLGINCMFYLGRILPMLL